jgi:hypothetical protein
VLAWVALHYVNCCTTITINSTNEVGGLSVMWHNRKRNDSAFINHLKNVKVAHNKVNIFWR